MTSEFIISPTDTIKGKTQNAPTGFKHVVEYYRNGRMLASRQVSYYNRTWESFEYESAIKELLVKMGMSAEDQKRILLICSGKSRAETDSMFKTVAATAALGEIFGKTPKEKNDWKARMLKAGLGNQGLEMPEDWESLSEAEKTKRLNKVIGFMKKR
jgi:hypothetical protein